MGQTSNVIQQIKSGKISPVYLLHGEETYLIEDTLADIIDILSPKDNRDFNLDIFSSPNVSINEIISLADTYPVMADRRVIVVKNPFLSASKNNPVEMLHESIELYRAGNITKSATLLLKCLNTAPEESAFRKSLDSFKKEYESELSNNDIDFLETVNIKEEFESISMAPNASELDILIDWMKDILPTTVLIIIVYTNLSSNDRLLKAVSQVGTVLGFIRFRQSTYVNRDPMYQMVVNKLKDQKKTIAPDAFSELQKKTGNDMRQIFDELDKISTYVGERQRIEKKDIEELVTKSDFEGIFDLTNAVAQKSLPLALANLRSILDKGDHPILIHSMLTRQIRSLLQVKLLLEMGHLNQEASQMNYDVFQQRVYKNLSPEVINQLPDSKQSNILKQPYPLHLTLRQAKNFTIKELTRAMERLLEADIQLKTGSLTPELVVEMLIIDLCSSYN